MQAALARKPEESRATPEVKEGPELSTKEETGASAGMPLFLRMAAGAPPLDSPHLPVSQPGDLHEGEADRVAEMAVHGASEVVPVSRLVPQATLPSISPQAPASQTSELPASVGATTAEPPDIQTPQPFLSAAPTAEGEEPSSAAPEQTDLIAGPSTGALSQLSWSPNLQQTAQQILAAVEAERSALAAEASRLRQVVQQQTLASITAIEAEGQATLAALHASLDTRRGEVRQAFAQAREAIDGQLASAMAATQAEREQAQAELTSQIDSQRTAAIEAAERQASQLETYGREQADRARGAGHETARRIESSASSAISSIGSVEPEVRSHVGSEVNQAASSASSDAESRAGEVADNAIASAATGAQGIRQAGQELAATLGSEGSADVVHGIQESSEETAAQLQAAAQQQMARLDQLEEQAESALAQAETQLGPAVDQIIAAATAQARAVGDSLVVRIDETAAAGSEALAQGSLQAVEQLHQVPTAEGEVDREAAAEYAAGAIAELHRAGVGVVAELALVRPDLNTALAQLQGEVSAGLGEHQTVVEGDLAAMAERLQNGANEAASGFETAATTAVDNLAEANRQAISDYTSGLGEQIAKAEQGWIENREEVEHGSGIQQDVDESIEEQERLRAEMPEQLATTAQEAAADAQSSWLGQVLSGIWEGVKNFFTGLLWFALAVLIVTGAIMLLAALGVVEITLGAALLVALAIVGVGFLIYGFITAMSHRSRQFWQKWGTDIPWWGQVLGFFMVFTVAVGDVFGVSGILEGLIGIDLVTWKDLDPKERSRRFTEGVLTLAFMFLMRGLVKRLGGGRGGTPPLEEVPPPERVPPERPVPRPGEPPPGLSPRLRSIRDGLSDPRAIEQFDRMFERIGQDIEKMERAIEQMSKDGSLEQKLIEDWERQNPVSRGEALAEVPPLLERAEALLGEVEAYRERHPEVRGVAEMRKGVRGEIEVLRKMSDGRLKATRARVEGSRRGLNGIEAELRAALRAKEVTGVNRKFSLDGRPDAVEVDVVSNRGRTWIEVKDVEPFGLESNNWKGGNGKQGLRAQAQKLLRSAQQNPVEVDGQSVTPEVRIEFHRGVSAEVAAELRSIGLQVVVREVRNVPVPPILVPGRNEKEEEER
jgi:hypothetical protein